MLFAKAKVASLSMNSGSSVEKEVFNSQPPLIISLTTYCSFHVKLQNKV